MSLTYNRKVLLSFTKEDELILDGQSKICNWLYNHLLAACQKDYQDNNNALQLLQGKNLRNYGVSLKETHPFLQTVFSSVLKDSAERLIRAFQSFFAGRAAYPRFRSWKKKWFSLLYDEPNKGWELQREEMLLSLSLGNIPDMPKEKGKRNPSVMGKLHEKIHLQEGETIKTLRICKQQGNKLYAIFTIERCSAKEIAWKEKMSAYRKACKQAKQEKKKLPVKPVLEEERKEIPQDVSWIALDPNHANFFVGVDHQGEPIECKKLHMMKYWDAIIDRLKSARDACIKSYRKRTTLHGNRYTMQSPRWNRFQRALDRAYHKRREQMKTSLYSLAHALYRRYDLVIIGDYTPTTGTAHFANMKRSMLNQEKIGEFRRILRWVSAKLQKHCLVVSEQNTTKVCCVCGHLEKKKPSIRSFVCGSCGTELGRDINAAVNIARKAGYSPDPQAYKQKWKTCSSTCRAEYGQKVSWIES